MSTSMKSMRDFKGSELNWVQTRAMERSYELRSDEELLATVTWVKVFGSLAEASTGDGTFTLKRAGFLQPYVTIRDAGTDSDIAVLKIGLFRHGTLEFSSGRRISLVSTRFFGYEWEFIDENGQKLCAMRLRVGVLKNTADVRIFEAIRRDRDLLIMLVIAWYAMLLIIQEAAVGAGASG